MDYYYGIDFGTTHIAAVCYAVGIGKPDVIKFGDEYGYPLPAIVAINRNTGDVITGREAEERKPELINECEYVYSIKGILDDENWELEANGMFWMPIDVAVELFKMVKNEVKKKGMDISNAFVSIPIGFKKEKRKLLREAAQKAGIHVTRFISEPTAAYFANYKELKSSENIIIFDWGGGTLDISVLKNDNGKISELATAGMEIAGDHIDKKIAKRIHEKITQNREQQILLDDMQPVERDTLLKRCELAKIALSESDTATIRINNYGKYGACAETLAYDWFSEIIREEINQAIDCLEKAINDSGVNITNINKIVLVGGSSNLRPLREKMRRKYGNKIYTPEETVWNIGEGTAFLSMVPVNVYTNQRIGIILSDGTFFELLSPDKKIEETAKTHYFGIVDTHEAARIIFSGSSDIDKSPDKYSVFELPAYKFLQEQIIIETMVDQDLIFVAKAKSDMRPDEFSRTWIYTKLKLYYKPDNIKRYNL